MKEKCESSSLTEMVDIVLNDSGIKEELKNEKTLEAEIRLTIPNIQKTVEEFYNISHNTLVSKKKDRNIAYARQMCMYLCYKLLDITVSAIGNGFNRDHSTVLHSIKVIESKLKDNREITEEIEILQKRILERD